jgi:alkylhydroperoxidase/carboxymuconolactone decarboxylase family protein YurZ
VTERSHGIDLAGVRDEALRLLADEEDGPGLDEVTRTLIGYAVCASVTTLDFQAGDQYAGRALDLGVTPEQLHEVLVLVSGLGVHTLMEGSRSLATLLRNRGSDLPGIDDAREALRERYVGSSRYWQLFESHVAGFLDALLRLSPAGFEGFMRYGAIPSQTKQLAPVVKEVISVAVDAMPTHRYMPGLRLHLANALALGSGRSALLEAIDIAAGAPAAPGVT